MTDETISCFKNRLSRAVILLKSDRLCGGEVLAETMDVFDLGASPSINLLVIVSHRHNRYALTC